MQTPIRGLLDPDRQERLGVLERRLMLMLVIIFPSWWLGLGPIMSESPCIGTSGVGA